MDIPSLKEPLLYKKSRHLNKDQHGRSTLLSV